MIIKSGTYSAEERVNMRGGEKSAFITPLVIEDLPGNCRLFSRIELSAGASIGYHRHEKETEIFYFISGHGLVRDNEETANVTEGDVMVTPSGHSHAVCNTGKAPLVFLANIVLDSDV